PPILLEGSENFPEYKGYVTDYAASMRAAYLLDPGAVPKTEADFAAEMAERMDTLRQRFEGEYEDLEVESKLPLASMITMAIAEQAKPTALLLHMKACMKPHIAAMFANVHSPSELWAELKHLYEKVALASAHETASTFRNLRFEDSMSIGAFAEKFSTLRSNLLLLGHDDASPHNAVTILIHAFESNLTQQNVCTNLKLAVGTAEVMRGNGRYQESNLKDGIQFLFSMQNNSKKGKARGSVNATEKKAGSRRPKSQVKGQKKEKDPNKCGICSGKHATRECRKCRTCKKEGHFAAQCPQKKDKETSSSSNTSGEVNVLQAVVTELDASESTLTHSSSSGSEYAVEQALAVVVATRTSTPSTVTNPLESIDSQDADTVVLSNSTASVSMASTMLVAREGEELWEEFDDYGLLFATEAKGGRAGARADGVQRVLLDSGATHSVFPDQSWFSELVPCNMTFATASKSQAGDIKCQWKGTVRLIIGGEVFDLKDVYLGPISRPILSMTSVVQAGFEFRISSDAGGKGQQAPYHGWLIHRGTGRRLRCLIGREGLPFIAARP
ncbi:hypothetical protein HDU96_004116, partial [Phlyctochytrium bullatum]